MKLTEGWNLCGIKILDDRTKLLPVYFHSIGHYTDQKHVFRPNGLGQYQLAICTGGRGVFFASCKEHSIEKGDVFFVSPDLAHEYYPSDNNWSIIWVVFNGKNVLDIMEYFSLKEVFVKRLNEKHLSKVINLCEELYMVYNSREEYDFSLTLTLQKLLQEVSYGEDISYICHNEKHNSGKESVSPSMDYIKKNYMESINLEDIAQKSEMSKSHFCRVFKNIYGVTPMAYLNLYRISVAKFLLTTTVENIDTIAKKIGFGDASYFCAVFRKEEKITPGQYRRRHEQ